MAITIAQEGKKQRYLLLILTLVIFATLLIVWLAFSRQRREAVTKPAVPVITYVIPKLEIDWQILDELGRQTFLPFQEITVFKGEFGRGNPFMPY